MQLIWEAVFYRLSTYTQPHLSSTANDNADITTLWLTAAITCREWKAKKTCWPETWALLSSPSTEYFAVLNNPNKDKVDSTSASCNFKLQTVNFQSYVPLPFLFPQRICQGLRSWPPYASGERCPSSALSICRTMFYKLWYPRRDQNAIPVAYTLAGNEHSSSTTEIH